MWFGETALSLPDLTEMRADATVDEADGGPVAEGQKVTLRLEARPDLDIRGNVRKVGHTVKQKSWRTPGKVFKVDVALEKTDPTVMRPAMRFRGEIETGRVPGLLLVPREAVFLRADGPAVFVRRAFGFREVRVTLGRKNRRQVEVLSGLREGDRLSTVDLRVASGTTTADSARRAVKVVLAEWLQGRRAAAGALGLVAVAALGASLARKDGGDGVDDLRGPARPLRPRGHGHGHLEGGEGHAHHRARRERPRAEGRRPRKNGAYLKAGDIVVEFDPWDAEREAADGNADLAAARAKIDKSKAEGGKTAKSLSLDRDVAKEALDQAETFKITDEQLYSRNKIIESALDRDLFKKKADVADRRIDTSGKLSAADRALGEIEAGKATVKVPKAEKSLRALRITAPHDGLVLLEKKWSGEPTFVGDSVWPGQKIARDPRPVAARGQGVRAGGRRRRSQAGPRRPPVHRRPAGQRVPGPGHERGRSRQAARSRISRQVLRDDACPWRRPNPAFMKPGERVRAEILLEEAEGVIAIPRGALFEKDGKRVVYRREGGGFEPVEVTVGRNSVSRVVVEKGLRSGDRRGPARPAQKATPAAGTKSGPGPVEAAP